MQTAFFVLATMAVVLYGLCVAMDVCDFIADRAEQRQHSDKEAA